MYNLINNYKVNTPGTLTLVNIWSTATQCILSSFDHLEGHTTQTFVKIISLVFFLVFSRTTPDFLSFLKIKV